MLKLLFIQNRTSRIIFAFLYAVVGITLLALILIFGGLPIGSENIDYYITGTFCGAGIGFVLAGIVQFIRSVKKEHDIEVSAEKIDWLSEAISNAYICLSIFVVVAIVFSGLFAPLYFRPLTYLLGVMFVFLILCIFSQKGKKR